MFTSAHGVKKWVRHDRFHPLGYRAVRPVPRFSFGRRPGPVGFSSPPAHLFIRGISKEQTVDRQKREHRKRMPVRKTILIAGIATLTLFNFDRLALAQSDPQASPPAAVQSPPAPSTDGHRIPDAPIGHVQPTLRDLPPGVAETETLRTKAQKDFDKKLQICRNC
jgi:hypothetical protein